VTRAIGYIRVSTKAQGQNGFGLMAQRDAIETYCEANELELLTVIPDVMSGRKADKLYGRAAAIAAIKTGLADVLVLKDFDRATRDPLDLRRYSCRREFTSCRCRSGWATAPTR
jgi:DNA invertase Pin-like site-specific DNA recombinase